MYIKQHKPKLYQRAKSITTVVSLGASLLQVRGGMQFPKTEVPDNAAL